MKFTQTAVENIKPTGERQWIRDDVSKGLTLIIGATGSKVWYYYYRDANGKKASRKLGDAQALTVAQARQMVKDFGGKVARGEDVRKEKSSDKITLGAYLNDNYFPHARTANKSSYEIIRAITAAFGNLFNKPIENITPVLVDKWRQSCRERGRTAATANRATTYLKAAFNYGIKSGLLEKNPIANMSPLKEYDSKYIVRYLSPDERERLEEALIERENKIRRERDSSNEWRRERGYETKPDYKWEFIDYLRPAVLLSLATGIRRGAMLALKWSDIDFDTQTFTLRSGDAKSGKTHRLPLSDDAIDILSSWRKTSLSIAPDALIFPSPKTGGQIKDIKSAWKKILEDADIENFRWHDLRHDFASQLVMKGVDLNTVRELLCHSDMKMTMRYAHLSPESKLNAVQVLNRRDKKDKNTGNIRKSSA